MAEFKEVVEALAGEKVYVLDLSDAVKQVRERLDVAGLLFKQEYFLARGKTLAFMVDGGVAVEVVPVGARPSTVIQYFKEVAGAGVVRAVVVVALDPRFICLRGQCRGKRVAVIVGSLAGSDLAVKGRKA